MNENVSVRATSINMYVLIPASSRTSLRVGTSSKWHNVACMCKELATRVSVDGSPLKSGVATYHKSDSLLLRSCDLVDLPPALEQRSTYAGHARVGTVICVTDIAHHLLSGAPVAWRERLVPRCENVFIRFGAGVLWERPTCELSPRKRGRVERRTAVISCSSRWMDRQNESRSAGNGQLVKTLKPRSVVASGGAHQDRSCRS